MTTAEWKDYLAKKQIPQLFESLLSGLMYYRPDDPVDYLDSCLRKVKELGGSNRVQWDTFLAQEKRTLPPLNGCQSRRSLFRNVLPDTPSFPYRRYDRLPPIHQFSIESDTDLCETAELIEEYTVFDPSKPRPWIILLIGGPGSGKGTQSLKIAKHYGFAYISVGDLLRKKMIHNTTCNRKWSLIAKIITNGELAPQETTITEIKRRLMQLPDAQGFVIDGFPRDVAQVLSFEDQICTPDLVVFLACASHQLKERLEKRAAQQGRPDDNPKAIQRRLTTFKQNTIPLVKYFQERGLIVTLDADRDEEEVFYDISVAVDNKLFPTKEPVAGPSELDLSLLVDATDIVDIEPDSDDQMDNWSTTSEDTKIEVNPKQAKIVFVIGGPGSGKGTQCKRIAAQYGFTYISSEDILRNVVAAGSERRRETRETMEPEELVSMEMLKDTINNSMDTKGILIDGYPQEVRQAEEFEKEIGQPSLVLFLSCSTDTLEQCLQKSAQASDGDDNVSRQIEAYLSAAQPIIEKYQRENLIHKINAEETPDKVFQQIGEAIRSIQENTTSHVTLDGFL